jgi:hypothetical protein
MLFDKLNAIFSLSLYKWIGLFYIFSHPQMWMLKNKEDSDKMRG